ncbi:MAG: DUF58 domain-containing protein [Dehalococcoidia bacterium]
MITRRGIGFIITAIAVFFLASTTRVGWVHLADAVLWGIVLVSLAVPWLTMPGLSASRILKRPTREGGDGLSGPVEGTSAPVAIDVENRWWLPRFLLLARFETEVNGVRNDQRFLKGWVRARGTSNVMGEVTFQRRGRHVLEPVTLESNGPFGLFRRRRTFGRPESLTVYPAWRHIDRVGLLEAVMGESEGRNRARTGTEVAGSRRYVAGDPYRSIHWKNSARTGSTTVKEFDSWSERSVTVAIDTSIILGEGAETTLEYSARLAASAARPIIRQQGDVRLAANGLLGTACSNWQDFMDELASLEPVDSAPGLETVVPQLGPGARLLAFTTPGQSSAIAALAGLSRRGVAVATVLFEGFTGSDSAAAAVLTLQQAGSAVLVCRRGAIDDAIAGLESGEGARVRPVVTISPDAGAVAA